MKTRYLEEVEKGYASSHGRIKAVVRDHLEIRLAQNYPQRWKELTLIKPKGASISEARSRQISNQP
jgi:hypothetical protein